jgi:hypothetical protein
MIVTQHIPPIKDPNSGNEDERFVIHLIGRQELISQRTILRRALNIIPPHEPQWKEWFDLCDKLDSILGV